MASGHVGKEVCVFTEDGKYHGTIHSVDGKNKKLILQKVSMPDGTKLRGLQIFFTNEIKDLQLLGDDETAADRNERIMNNTESLNESGQNGDLHPDNSFEPETTLSAKDPSDDGPRLLPRKPLAPSQYLDGEESFLPDSREEEFKDPPEVVFIDELEEKFDAALENINEQKVIGLSAEGEKIGRSGKLCLLIVGCRRTTYIFDVFKLGEECFPKGLKALLEDCYILKVIHDSRLLSDCFYNQYQTKMKNIFDTQVADIIIFKQNRGRLPREVNGLEPCLYEYLNISPEKCKCYSVISKHIRKNLSCWTTRPLPLELMNAAAEKVMFLRELRLAQMENMLAEFLYGVNIYLEAFRDSKMDISNSFKNIRKVPDPFHGLGKIAERRWKRLEDRDKKWDPRDDGGNQSGNRKEGADTESPDFGFTEGRHFATMYNMKHGKILERDDLVNKKSSFAYESRVDTEKSPWSSIRENPASNQGVNGGEMILRSEEVMRGHNTKKKKGFQQNSTNQINSKSSALHDGNKLSNSLIGKDMGLKDEPPSIVIQGQTIEENEAAGSPINSHDQKNGGNATTNVLSAIPRRNTPIDWFDYDGSLSDRSRSSSIDSNASSKSKGKFDDKKKVISSTNENNNVTRYNEDFPALSSDSQQSTPDKHVNFGGKSPTNAIQSRDKDIDNAKRDLFGISTGLALGGVLQQYSKPVSIGRAKLRDHYLAMTSATGSPTSNGTPGRRVIGIKDTHTFPSDHDLLNADPVIKATHTKTLQGGQTVKLQKITRD